RFVYYDFPLPQHPHAFLAARAARCANEQERFWDYHDVLYARQATWSGMRDATDFFIDLAGDLNLDEGSFEACVRSDRFQEEVSRRVQQGRVLGVQSRSSLFVNVTRVDLRQIPSVAQLEEIVRAEMGSTAAVDSVAPADTSATP